ncbi:hypothetical protein J3R83DRAFT_11654 [Lanmaoa asiatica]|nr:hypothetical protein J3R83DRAFT_11654 [Lanmaoa asiatica]
MEDFLRERKKILGDSAALLVTLRSEGVEFKTIEEAKPHLEQRRAEFLDEYCTKPLLQAAEGHIPHIAVSTKSHYGLEPTISELVKITTSEIERYIKDDPSYTVVAERPSIERDAPYYIAAMAQRASIEAKVNLTVVLAKKRYWRSFGAGLKFSSDKVEEYLLAIHLDIIQVWNFNDPEMALQSDDFKAALLDASNLGVRDIEVARTAIFQIIAKRFMAYITDVIYVMRILFILVPQGPITSQDVALALKVYEKSTYRNRVHSEIHDFSAGVMLPGGRDVVLDKIEVLIRRYNITDEEVSRLRGSD